MIKFIYIFTVIVAPHTWYELENVEDHVKKYILWDEFSDMYLPSSAFYSWIKDNYCCQQIIRARCRLRWKDLKHIQDITELYDGNMGSDFHNLNFPKYLNEDLAVEYFSKINIKSNFSDYKILSIFVEPEYYNLIRKLNPEFKMNEKKLIKEIKNPFGFDIQNAKDFGRNLRYHIADIVEKYDFAENKNGLINDYQVCKEIIDNTDIETIKNSSYTIDENKLKIPCYKTKDEWIPVAITEVNKP